MLYNIFPNPCQCTKMIIRRLRRRLGGVCNTPLQSWYTDILRIKMYPGRGAKAYAIRTFPKETKRHAKTQKRSFAASGCVWGAYAFAPLQSWYTDILRIKIYPGRGVSNTPSERFQRKRRDTPRHKNDHSPPPAAFGRRIRYAPTILVH